MQIILIIALWQHFQGGKHRALQVATVFAIASIVFLFVNAILSLYSISQISVSGVSSENSGANLNMVIGLLGLASVMLDGGWYLGLHWYGLRDKTLPKGLSYLGLGLGCLSLIPFLAIVVLVLSIAWAIWFGSFFLQRNHQ